MRIIEAPPAPCALCGTGNTPTNDRAPRRFLDLERDVNWNDPLIFCEDCVLRIGGMMGLLDASSVTDLRHELRRKDTIIHEKQVEIDSMKTRAKRLGITIEPAPKRARSKAAA